MKKFFEKVLFYLIAYMIVAIPFYIIGGTKVLLLLAVMMLITSLIYDYDGMEGKSFEERNEEERIKLEKREG